MKNILARGGIEFIAVFLGLGLSLWVDEYLSEKEFKEQNFITLKRLYDNLENDSTDINWNINTVTQKIKSASWVKKWCDEGMPDNDSSSIYISGLAITKLFLNNVEEYNSLKSSGKMGLLNNDELIEALHDYYSYIPGVKLSDEILTDISNKEFIPFMRDYADDIGYSKSINIDPSPLIGAYPYFRLKTMPPKDKLRYFSSHIGVFSFHNRYFYNTLKNKLIIIRKIIRSELKDQGLEYES
tara:strand:- start:709 stop:1431 length:723 start_codon:yes stop_codon:yes gene_type:complete